MFIQEFYSNIHGINTSMPQFVTTFRSTRIVVTPDLTSEVLCVLRVAHPDYPNCDRLQTVSRDKLITSIIDVYQDTATRDKLIFPTAIMRILQHFHIPIPLSPLSLLWVLMCMKYI